MYTKYIKICHSICQNALMTAAKQNSAFCRLARRIATCQMSAEQNRKIHAKVFKSHLLVVKHHCSDLNEFRNHLHTCFSLSEQIISELTIRTSRSNFEWGLLPRCDAQTPKTIAHTSVRSSLGKPRNNFILPTQA
jgi:hypothetical protein